MNAVPVPVCIGCKKYPRDLEEYVEAAEEEKITPDAYVRHNEGTYNPINGHFLCTDCYIDAGMPSGPHGWVAP